MSNTTVVISNYNYEKYVVHAIQSCFDQSVRPKVIVVDDHSTDNSWNLITQYIDTCLDFDIKAVRLSYNSKGNARGKNVGICLSDTDYIVCLDSDDMLTPNSIRCREQAIEKYDFIHGWSCNVECSKGINSKIKKLMDGFSKNDSCDKHKNKRVSQLIKEGGVRKAWFIEASTVMAKKSLYIKLGLYDEEMRWKIDREMWWRWLKHNAIYGRIDKYVSLYRKHDNQLTKNLKLKNPKKCEEIMKKKMNQRSQVINTNNTLLLSDYKPYKYIGETYGF